MHGLTRLLGLGVALSLALPMTGCAKREVVRDHPVVEQYRSRITKVRNAIDETRDVIATSRRSPHIAELHMRLAELLSEEARYHYLIAFERGGTQDGDALHVPQVVALKEEAIAAYKRILSEYPDTHLADRILFNISHEYRELGKFDEMRAALRRIVAEHPTSIYRNEAMLVLGDDAFDRTLFIVASEYYKKIIADGEGPLQALAHYKLAWVKINEADCKAALANFESALSTSKGDETKAYTIMSDDGAPVTRPEFGIPDQTDVSAAGFAGHQAVNVQREALIDLAYCYTQVRKPEEAVSYLRERAVSREIYTAALGRMSSRLRVGEHHAAAADATRELLRYAPDDGERLHDARMLHSLVIQSETYQRVGDDVSLILQAMRRRVLQPDLTAEQRAQLMEEFELLARDLSTRAQKSTGAFTDEPPAENAPTDTQVIAAYDAYLTYLPASPYRLEIVQNLADALGSDDQYLAAGHRYLEAADLCLAREDAEEGCREEALYSSVFAYREHLERNKIQRFTEQVTARAGLRVAGGLYLEEAEPEVDTAVKIKFAIASTYYDEGNYLEAIDLLTALAYQYPQTEQGTAAVNMALDSMRAIDDIDSLIGAGQRFLSEDSPFAQALQDDIKPILAAAEQRQIDAYSLAAAGDDVGGVDALMAFVDRYEGTSLGERALLNSFMSARAQGDTAQLYEIGEKFLDDYKTSEQSAGVATTLGQTAAARFEYDRAITYFERAANLNPEQGPALMFTVGTLKEQLGDLSGAAEVYQRLLNDGERKREAAVRVADIQMAQRQYDSAVRTLSPFAGSGDPEALSRLGMAMLQTGDIFEAENHFLAVTQSPGAASGTAISRAAYGQAEVSMSMLESYEPSPGLEAIEESIGLIDLVVQGYLQAARQPDPVYAQAALARLARAAEIGAEIMGGIEIPPEIGADDRTILEDAILVRATQLTEASQEALAECANHAQIHFLFDDSGKACLSGAPPKQNPVQPQKLSPRKRVAQPAGIDAVLEKVARNNDDVDAIREAGEAYLGAGDPHTARLILSNVADKGGGAEELYLLGVAAYDAGDTLGALNALGRSMEAGSEPARARLAAISQQMGLSEYAANITNGETQMAVAPTDGTALASLSSSAGQPLVPDSATSSDGPRRRLITPKARPVDVDMRDPRLSAESRFQLIEAEDEVAIAAAKVDDARLEVARFAAYRQRFSAWLKENGQISSSFSEYMQRRMQLRKMELTEAQRALDYAVARWERTRAEVAIRNDIAARPLEPFDLAVDASRENLEVARNKLGEQRAKTEQAATTAWQEFAQYVSNGGLVDALWTINE